MMTHHKGKLLIGVITTLLTGCAELASNAPIDDRTESRYKVVAQKPKPAEPSVVDPPGFYTVKKGDNLMKIALQFNQN